MSGWAHVIVFSYLAGGCPCVGGLAKGESLL